MVAKNRHRIIFGLLLLGFAAGAVAKPVSPPDPLESPQWETMHQAFLGGEPVVFDDRVRILAPIVAEDSMATPVWLDARELGVIERIVVVADLNPLPKVLEFMPGRAVPRLGFKIKIQQATPIRVAAKTPDGVWHVGGRWIDAAGGGCTAPSIGSGNADWSERLGQVSARIWPREDGGQRLRFSVMHPMDTGLAAGIPVFHVERITFTDAAGNRLAELLPLEPVSENPLFTIDFPFREPIRLMGRDNNGNTFEARIDK